MANVYLAHDLILDRDVAVKILRGDLADDEKFVRRFQREAIAASSLSHPNIVEMYDVGEDDGKYYIVMEYVEGKTLKSLIKKRGGLTLPEVIDIMTQLTSAIACAHDSNIIHRDIKPQNVLIKEDGIVKITDFGIAMALNSNELTQTNSVMGSVHYLPPEQANGKGATLKSDIYSLGIVMFELLTGQLPFKGDNAVEIAIKQMKNQIPSVCSINKLIPQSVENIILKACAKNPKNRYNTVVEMYNDIETCLDEERMNEKRHVYQYSETEDIEDTKELKNIKEIKEKSELDEIEDEETDNKSNKPFIIIGIIIATLIIGAIIAIIAIPKTTKVKEIMVPDVSKLTIAAAESKLKEAGFEVNEQREERTSKEIEEGYVITTDPPQGVNRKKGTVKGNTDERKDWNTPCIKGDYVFASVHDLLPDDLKEAIDEGMSAFGRMIEGFDADDTLMEGVESRTSSPVRITRGEDLQAINTKGLYPCGEGAGYAGGIMSAAMDGMKVAAKICSERCPGM